MREHDHLADEELLLAIDGEVSSCRQETIDLHVAVCAVCRQRLSALQAVDSTGLATADAARGTDSVSPVARVRLSAALRAADHDPRRWWARAGAPPALFPMAAVAAAAALVLLVVAPTRQLRATANTPLPDARLTPGAISALTAAELCAGARPSRVVTVASRQTVLRSYQMEQVSDELFELDALITPELGGTTESGNLWPQRYAAPVWNAAVKDQLERLLPELVCSHQVTLAEAQHEIATDWIAAYRKYFSTDVPLVRDATHVVDDDELIFERVAPGWRTAAGSATPRVAASAPPRLSLVTASLAAGRPGILSRRVSAG